jgi:hypothetical protein
MQMSKEKWLRFSFQAFVPTCHCALVKRSSLPCRTAAVKRDADTRGIRTVDELLATATSWSGGGFAVDVHSLYQWIGLRESLQGNHGFYHQI